MDETSGRYCESFHHAVELLGRRWNGVIIRALLSGTDRFNGIRAAVPGLSDRMLSERLQQLECEGLLMRVCGDPAAAPRYVLTEKGQNLRPVIEAIYTWAATPVNHD
ncbi:winged helix-turn-helix transcriptional regulator [Pseudarthrobacter sp. NKDBFgelt]|uniref:winged helix-turn-helix transcriptional regulator n=1 Tax=Pseudarthrobacter sp. NKDBFgelt TaxID=3384443 RepID=UPI0038D4BA3E